MPDEIAKADWIPLADMSHFRFTSMARNICRILVNMNSLQSGPIDLKQMPIDDVFKDVSFTQEEYQLMGTTQRLFSSHYMRRVGDYIKSSQSKL